VRLVQEARKAAGLDVSDRIILAVEGDEEIRRALDVHGDWIAGEVLASEMSAGSEESGGYRERRSIDGREVTVTVRKV
jgi:isoleucyl-tRNA synthetase